MPVLLGRIDGFRYEVYREPFLGGGAIYLALNPERAVLSDINQDLINTWQQVRRRPGALAKRLRALPVNLRTYQRLRGNLPRSGLDRAVRFLYLNRTGFGGMYRLNGDGRFNVPFGGGARTPAPLWRRGLLAGAARALRNATLSVLDFEPAIARAQAGDLVYCDPTYTVAHNNNGFVRYNEKNFSWDDQKRLAASCRAAASRGALVIVSNAFHKDLLDLFRPPEYLSVTRTSCLCPEPKHRRSVMEYVFVYPPSKRKHSTGRGQRAAREE